MTKKERRKEYLRLNKEKIAEKAKKYREKNKERLKEKRREYVKNNKEKVQEQRKKHHKKHYEKNKKIIAQKTKELRKQNKEKISEQNKKYYSEKIKKLKSNGTYEEYRRKEKLRMSKYVRKPLTPDQKIKKREYNREYVKKRKSLDYLFKLKSNVRTLIYNAIKYKKFDKNKKTEEILGCTFEEFNQYLESKFELWMTWDNYGDPEDNIIKPNNTWDIDHIVPLSSANNEKDIIHLNHYTNLQPLCSYINRVTKRNTYS